MLYSREKGPAVKVPAKYSERLTVPSLTLSSTYTFPHLRQVPGSVSTVRYLRCMDMPCRANAKANSKPLR